MKGNILVIEQSGQGRRKRTEILFGVPFLSPRTDSSPVAFNQKGDREYGK